MVGQIEAFNYFKNCGKFSAIFVIVGEKPNWFNPQRQVDLHNPLIYTEKRSPQPIDLLFIKSQIVHLIHGTSATDELFAKWFSHLTNLKPKMLLASDSTEEMYVYK